MTDPGTESTGAAGRPTIPVHRPPLVVTQHGGAFDDNLAERRLTMSRPRLPRGRMPA